jgi:hypothetical protein
MYVPFKYFNLRRYSAATSAPPRRCVSSSAAAGCAPRSTRASSALPAATRDIARSSASGGGEGLFLSFYYSAGMIILVFPSSKATKYAPES